MAKSIWGTGHHPWLGHGDVGPDKPGPDKPLGELAKEVGDFVKEGAQKGGRFVVDKAGPVANALAPGGRKLATKALGSVADIALDATPAGANSDKVPPPSGRQLKVMQVGEDIKKVPL